MTILEINNMIKHYNDCETQRAWSMDFGELEYVNEYVAVRRIDSSNRWVGPNKMEKVWSVILNLKKDFENLPTYIQLRKNLNVAVTPVRKGRLSGCYGLRIYGMRKEPTAQIIKEILDFIFEV